VDACSAECVRAQLVSARDHLCSLLIAGRLAFDVTELAPWMKHVMAAACVGHPEQAAADVDRGCCALIINGHSLVRSSPTRRVEICAFVLVGVPAVMKFMKLQSCPEIVLKFENVLKSRSFCTNVLILTIVVRAKWQFNVLLSLCLSLIPGRGDGSLPQSVPGVAGRL